MLSRPGKKPRQALKLYQDKAASAIKEFKALRNTLDDKTAKLDGYHQNYLATQTAVIKLVDALPESKVRRAILGVLATFTHVDEHLGNRRLANAGTVQSRQGRL